MAPIADFSEPPAETFPTEFKIVKFRVHVHIFPHLRTFTPPTYLRLLCIEKAPHTGCPAEDPHRYIRIKPAAVGLAEHVIVHVHTSSTN
jgi:hypothetical protein